MSRHLSLVAGAVLVSVPCLIVWRGVVHARKLERARREALSSFHNLRVISIDPKLGFSGSTATIVKLEEPSNAHREPASWFTLTIFARNEYGEYFMFKSTKPEPFLKHVTHAIAKQVLKNEYKTPPSR